MMVSIVGHIWGEVDSLDTIEMAAVEPRSAHGVPRNRQP
jgi:hypothetical protein